ncbi:hypothetical protein [Halorientalis litorea]|uniref:hypothetical protein n=1 Tax=Halorientalis litorea TaxID=2931977 RepID=UPI001FF2B8A6|nr:hypothetical protein [Halorientalis litorea]
MRRRQFLASGTALLSVAVAGCGHPSVVFDMNDATADDIADEVSTVAAPGSDEYPVVSDAVQNGTATRWGRRTLFDRVDTVRYEDAFYDVTETRVETSEVTVYEVMVDFNPGETSPEAREIAYDDLPETDRQRLDRILSEDEPPQREGFDAGIGYGSETEVGNDSVFVPDQQYDVITRGEDRYRIGVESRTTEAGKYRYEVTEVAPDVETFVQDVRDQYLFVLSGLSDAERAVVEEAIDGAYFEDDDAFRSLVDRFRARDGFEVTDAYGTWLVEYEGDEYITYVEW